MNKHEQTIMDVMGRLVYYALVFVVIVGLIWLAQPLLIVPVVVVAAIVLVAWNEAKVPLEMPRRNPSKKPLAAAPPEGVYPSYPEPLELEAEWPIDAEEVMDREPVRGGAGVRATAQRPPQRGRRTPPRTVRDARRL